MNLLILAAYGRMARIVEDRILSEPDFKEVTLTLGRRKSDRLLRESGLDRTTLRLCRLTDRDEVRYVTTRRDETFKGVSGSRKSAADPILRIVKDPAIGANDSPGIADPTAEGSDRPRLLRVP